MTDSERGSLLRYARVEDYLGPGGRRFFGEGYKRAHHLLRDLSAGTDHDGVPRVTGMAAVSYPADWSRKGHTDQRPHLSTVDVLLLGVQLAEIHLAHRFCLDDEQRADMWIRRVRIKAGRSPVEEDLAGFPVVARCAGSSVSPGFPRRRVSTVHCTVGALKITLDLDHAQPGAVRVPVPLELGERRRRPFGDGYKACRQHVTDVTVSPDRTRSTALVRLESRSGTNAPGIGVEGRHQPSVGLIDAFVVALQLGQIMLYELDHLTRTTSDTLWMRSTLFNTDSPYRPAGGALPVAAALENPELLHKGTQSWRRADITAALEGVRVTCSVAHRLP